MRILHVLDHSLPVQSGYVYRTLAILREQAALGWQTSQLTTPKHPLAHEPVEVVDGWEFHRTSLQRSRSWMPKVLSEYAMLRATARRLEELARQWRPDVIHAHSPVLNAWAALAVGRRLEVPVVYEIRALWEDAALSHGTMKPNSVRYAMARHLETRAARRADAVVTISRGLSDELRGRGVRQEDLFVVANAVDADRFLPDHPMRRGIDPNDRSTRAPVIGFIGSFYSYEGLDLLVEAASRLVRLRPHTRFVLVGGGPEEARLRDLCRARDLNGCMTFAGWVPHERIDECYRQIDIMVYPRRRNRLTELVTPLKPLEAMAKGKIVLASDVGGHRELIEDGQNGFLFEAEDVSDLLRRLLDLIDTPVRGVQTGAAGRRFVEEERTWKAVAAAYARVYERALAKARRMATAAPPATRSSTSSPDPDL
ncbi:MAG: TIGR04063 family PEP-CTERM/XrtA system glycosyltransferase [Geminicoccaceae bacterium]